MPSTKLSTTSTIHQWQGINALNREPFVPRSEDQRFNITTGQKVGWIKTADRQGTWKRVAAENAIETKSVADLKEEFQQSLKLLQQREGPRTSSFEKMRDHCWDTDGTIILNRTIAGTHQQRPQTDPQETEVGFRAVMRHAVSAAVDRQQKLILNQILQKVPRFLILLAVV